MRKPPKILGTFAMLIVAACAGDAAEIETDADELMMLAASDHPYGFFGECPIISSHGWEARILPPDTPDGPKIVEVSANITTPVPNFLFTWREANDSELIGRTAVLDLEMLPPVRRVSDIVTSQPVTYRTDRFGDGIREIRVRCGEEVVETLNAIDDRTFEKERTQIQLALEEVRGKRVLTRKTAADIRAERLAKANAEEAEKNAVLAMISDGAERARSLAGLGLAEQANARRDALVAGIAAVTDAGEALSVDNLDLEAAQVASSEETAEPDAAPEDNPQSSMAYLRAALNNLDDAGEMPERRELELVKTSATSGAADETTPHALGAGPFGEAVLAALDVKNDAAGTDPRDGDGDAAAFQLVSAEQDAFEEQLAEVSAQDAMADDASDEIPTDVETTDLVEEPRGDPAQDPNSSIAHVLAALDTLDAEGKAPTRQDHVARLTKAAAAQRAEAASPGDLGTAIRGIFAPFLEPVDWSHDLVARLTKNDAAGTSAAPEEPTDTP